MAYKSRREQLEEQLDARQIRAAYLLIENELLSRTDPDYKTQEEIAKEVGVRRESLWRWRKQDQTFIEYRKEIAKDYLGDSVNIFVDALIRSMRGTNGVPSMKALDLYAKHIGFIQPDNQVEVNVGGGRSEKDLQDELKRLDEQLAQLDDKGVTDDKEDEE